MNVCYFIQSHRDPEQILRLARVLRTGGPGSTVVIQHNGAASPLDWAPFAAVPGLHRMDVPWRQVRAHYSCQVQPTLYAVEWLDRQGIGYDWLVTLTAQDYPVRPMAAIERDLAAADVDAFLRFWDVRGSDSPWSFRKAKARYWHRYRRWPESTLGALRALRRVTKLLPVHFYLDYGPWVGVRRLRTPWSESLRCYGGWAWFALRREAARFVVAELARRPELAGLYQECITPEESIVQTVLVNGGGFRLRNDDRRYIDYRGAVRGSPRTLGHDDVAMLGAGRYDFARKFELPAGAAVLDRIDRELLRL